VPNGEYGRFVPRLALAVAEYRARHGEWPTAAKGYGVEKLLVVAETDDPEEGLRPGDPAAQQRAAGIRRRLSYQGDDGFIEVGGRDGWNSYGGPDARATVGTPEFEEALEWLYGSRGGST
jgi:hypothetical protein